MKAVRKELAMMNRIFVGMILLGIVVSVFLGNVDQVALQFVDSSKEAVELSIVMLGVVGMWTGMMKVAEAAGISRALAKRLSPLILFLYPELKGANCAKAREYIAQNMTANFLGLGWAATPTGIKAMEELKNIAQSTRKPLQNKEKRGRCPLENDRHISCTSNKNEISAPTNSMCMFLLINVSSLQLIPINIIAYRSKYGAVNPSAIIAPAVIATTCSTLVAIFYGKYQQHKSNKSTST